MNTLQTPLATPADVLDFWLGDGVQLGWPTQDLGKRWFGGGAAHWTKRSNRVSGRVCCRHLTGALGDWPQAQPPTPALGQLAHILLLDQFTRNVFRGDARAFSGDEQAQQLVQQALASRKTDQQLPWVGRVFMYMPLMHAESRGPAD